MGSSILWALGGLDPVFGADHISTSSPSRLVFTFASAFDVVLDFDLYFNPYLALART